jgi:hypothetical protein
MSSLLDGLADLDLTKMLDARGSIRAAVSTEDLERLTSGGAAQTALAGLGTALAEVEEALQDPAALARPLADALGELGGAFALDDEVVGRYLGAVREGAELVAGLFEGLDGDPAALGRVFGSSLGEALELVEQSVGGSVNVALDPAREIRALIDALERGVPSDPVALGRFAAETFLPFSAGALGDVRDRISGLHSGALSIQLPPDRTAGLLHALDGITAAAVAADEGALERALADLERIRATTVASITTDLGQAVELIGRLHVAETLEAVASVGDALQTAERGVLDALDQWRDQIVLVREQIESVDAEDVAAVFDRLLDLAEQAARGFEASVDAQVERAKVWVRELLAHLGLRALRAELSAFIHSIAQEIEDADLDRFARDAHRVLEQLSSAITSANVAGEIREQLDHLRELLEGAVGQVAGALEDVKAELDRLMDPALEALQGAAQALGAFKATVDAVVADVNNLGIEEAGQQVVDTLREIRETAEQLLSVVPLPESLRPVVEQLIETVESVDLRPVLKQVEEAAAQLRIPDELGAEVEETLQKAQDAIDNLIPDTLVASIEQEVSDTLAVIGEFNPASFLGSVSEFVDSVADTIHDVDLTPIAQTLEPPFQEVLVAIDAVHPRTLLQPAIDVFDSLLGELPGGKAAGDALTGGFKTLVGTSGDAVTRAATAPAQAVAPGAQLAQPEPTGTFEEPPHSDSVRAGDIVRVIGFIPAKVREGLLALEAGPAGEALRAIDDLTAGLARDLRSVEEALFEIEDRLDGGIDDLLAPLAVAQVRAQLAIRANFSAGSFHVEGALDAVALVGPGPLRSDLTEPLALARERARAAAEHARDPVLGRIASALEQARLTGLAGDLDGLLAALDPEPIAVEVDRLVDAALRTGLDVLREVGEQLKSAVDRLKALLGQLNPGVQIQKFVTVLDVLREEVELLSPRRLADELAEVHAAIRDTVAAYDPARFVADLQAVLASLEAEVRALDPAQLLGGVSFEEVENRLHAAVPTNILHDLDTSLDDVGRELGAIDPAGLLDAVNGLAPRVAQEFRGALEATKEEILALLKSLKFATGSASASVEVKL